METYTIRQTKVWIVGADSVEDAIEETDKCMEIECDLEVFNERGKLLN